MSIYQLWFEANEKVSIDKLCKSFHTGDIMKRKHVSSHRHHTAKVSRREKPAEGYLVIVRSWMLLVMFALMLGLGAVVGTFLNAQNGTPTVAGVQTEAK